MNQVYQHTEKWIRSLQVRQDIGLPGNCWWNWCPKMCFFFLEEKEQSLFPILTQSGAKNYGNPGPAHALGMRWDKRMGTIIQRQSVSTPERSLSGLWRGVRVGWGFRRGVRWSCTSLSCWWCLGDTFVSLFHFPLLLPLSFQHNYNMALLLSTGKDKETVWPDWGQQSWQNTINDQSTKISLWIPTRLVEKMGTAEAQGSPVPVTQSQLSQSRRSGADSFCHVIPSQGSIF